MTNIDRINKLKEIATNENVFVNQYNVINYNTVAGQYRLKIKKNVVRREAKTSMGDWIRVQSYKISNINFDKWQNAMKQIANYS